MKRFLTRNERLQEFIQHKEAKAIFADIRYVVDDVVHTPIVFSASDEWQSEGVHAVLPEVYYDLLEHLGFKEFEDTLEYYRDGHTLEENIATLKEHGFIYSEDFKKLQQSHFTDMQ